VDTVGSGEWTAAGCCKYGDESAVYLATELVIPNMATPRVIVLDNASYHGEKVRKPPIRGMLEYLRRHGVTREEGMRKYTLFSLAEKIIITIIFLTTSTH
jgi:hypothetical protein